MAVAETDPQVGAGPTSQVTGRPTVAVWKANWLPPSQTFVRDQVATMSRWRPLKVGLWSADDSICDADLAPFGRGRVGRALHRLSAATGYRGVYDRRFRREGVRVVHAHFLTSATRVLPVVERLGLPLVVTAHGYDVLEAPFGPGGAQYRARLARVLDRADLVLAVSQHLADALVALGAPAERVRVQPLGIPVDRAVPAAPERRGIVFVGRLVEGKGPDHLLRALARLDEPYRSTPVRIVGAGPMAGDLAALAEREGLDVTLLGRRTSDEVAAELARAAVFCAPSRTSSTGWREAFGIVFLEAALHSLPVVAYRHAGVTESVADGVTGLLADEDDEAGLAAHLRTLLADPDLGRRLGEAGRARVLSEFDMTRRTAELEALYDEVVARAAGRRYST